MFSLYFSPSVVTWSDSMDNSGLELNQLDNGSSLLKSAIFKKGTKSEWIAEVSDYVPT